jgi:DNA-binding Xre family transcriptional regulator
VSVVPYYSSRPSEKRLVNRLNEVLAERGITSFRLSKIADLSPTTTRNICVDEFYIPSPEVLEKICIVLEVQPGELLKLRSKMEAEDVAVSSCSLTPITN